MADTKISALPASTVPLAGTEVLPIVQSSATKQVSVANLTAGRSFDALGMTLTSTDDGAAAAPLLELYRDSASPAASDTLGEIEFNGEDSAGNKQAYALFHGSILSPTSGSEQGQLHFETATAGALTEKMIIGTTNLVINEIGAVFNVRIEGDTDANLFYTDATNSRVGVGTASPAVKLDVVGTAAVSGDLGIGTTSPTAKLEVNDYINTSYAELVAFTGAKGSFVGIPTNQLAIVDSTAQAAGVGGEIIFEGKYDASNITAFASVGGVKENSTSGNYGGAFVVRTRANGGNLNEGARIDSSGNLLVGTTSLLGSGKVGVLKSTAGQVLVLQNSVVPVPFGDAPYGISISYTGGAPNDTQSEFLYFDDNTPTLRMSVRSNGGIANYAANNVILSDRREKTNFAPAASYLDKICAIPVQTFNYIDQNLEQDAGLTLGVVAQDVQAVAPELVTESNWAAKDQPEKMRLEIYQTDLQYALMKCIQEQQALIESLATRLTALENK